MPWLIVSGPEEYEASGVDPDTVLGWAYTIERGDERQTIRVELSAIAVDDSAVVDEGSRQAINTRGRSAVEASVALEPPPTRLVISTHGIAAPDDDADQWR
jgi:hypothetical protein